MPSKHTIRRLGFALLLALVGAAGTAALAGDDSPGPIQANALFRSAGTDRQERAAGPGPAEKPPAPPGDAKEGKDGDEDKDEEKPDEPPGLLGQRLHGRDWLSLEYIYTGDVLNNNAMAQDWRTPAGAALPASASARQSPI